MRSQLFLILGVFVLAGAVLLAASARADSFTDPTNFAANAGTLTEESFETITWDSWIYHTRLPSPLQALDTSDDPTDPNDGPNYDLDGHFSVTGNNIAYAPADELFKVFRVSPTTGDPFQVLSFSPWYLSLWPSEFDKNNLHPTVTFDNFNNSNDAITSFGLTLYDYTPDPRWWIVMQFGNTFVELDLSGPRGNYFFGYVGTTPFSQVALHTNQNGSSINIDDVFFGQSTGVVPEPASVVLLAAGCLGVFAARRRMARH